MLRRAIELISLLSRVVTPESTSQRLTEPLRASFACANVMIKKLAPACGGGYGLALFDLDAVARTTGDQHARVVERTTDVLKILCGVPSIGAVAVKAHVRVVVAAVTAELEIRLSGVCQTRVAVQPERLLAGDVGRGVGNPAEHDRPFRRSRTQERREARSASRHR